ncbi:MAG: nickel insertion protein, partial [Halobaculum sp.]
MRTLAFDGRMGASGDMLLAALVAAGADPDTLAPVTDVLPVAYEFDDVVEQGIAAKSARVVYTEDADTGADRDESSGDNEGPGNGDSASEDETATNGSADTDGGDHHNHG